MMEKEKIPGEIALTLIIAITAIGLFATVMASKGYMPFRQFILAIVRLFDPAAEMSNVDGFLLMVKSRWYFVAIAIIVIYLVYWIIRKPETAVYTMKGLFGMSNLLHKISERSRYSKDKSHFHSIKREKEKELESIRKQIAQDLPHIDKEKIESEIKCAIQELTNKQQEVTIRAIMKKVEEKRTFTIGERLYWLDVVKDVCRSNRQMINRKKDSLY